jgi:hypothetical protein
MELIKLVAIKEDNFYGQVVLVDDAMLSTLKNGL